MVTRVIDDMPALLDYLSKQPLILAAKRKEMGLPPPPYVPLDNFGKKNSNADEDLLAALQDMA